MTRSFVVFLLIVLTAGAGWALSPLPARSAPGEGTLRERIERGRERERSLSGAVARLGQLVARSQREVSVIQGRLTAVQSELDAAQARLDSTRVRLRDSRGRLASLRARLARGRRILAEQLRANYKADQPDIVSVVLGAHGFADLLERAAFIRRVRVHNTRVVDGVRGARDETRRQAAVLKRLEATRQTDAEAIARRRDAIAQMESVLRARRDTLARARAARAAALSGARADRAAAQRSLDRLLAERARAARVFASAPTPSATSGGGSGNSLGSGGGSGGWAIPWPIVQCESGGQNLTPNSAGASGYYQILDTTWAGLGGSTPHAYQASKAEQDRLAAKLWAGGAGRGNWVCSALVD